MPVDEPIPSIRELIASHQENAGAASIVALLFAVVYAAFKRLSLRKSLMAAGAGALLAAVAWVVTAEYLRPPAFWLLVVGFLCGLGAFPLFSAWVKEDDRIAEEVVSGAGGLLARLAKRFTGNKADDK